MSDNNVYNIRHKLNISSKVLNQITISACVKFKIYI